MHAEASKNEWMIKKMLHNISKVNIQINVMKPKIWRNLTMALKDTVKHMRDLLGHITHDLEKADGGNKAASQRVRTGTVKLEKLAKTYRKESIKTEKATKGQRKPAKKAAPKAKAKPAHKAKAKPAHKAKAHKATARPRALSLKKPSARLPMKRAGAR